MPNYRSFNFLQVCAIGLLAASLVFLGVTGQSVVTWILLVITGAVASEWQVVSQTAKFAEYIYDKRSSDIAQLSYSPASSLVRIAVLSAYFAIVVVAGQAGLRDSFWLVFAILAPMVIYIVWAATQLWREIKRCADRDGWRRRGAVN